jgi:predicted Zn-dependent peptidase
LSQLEEGVTSSTLDNGIRVVTERMPDARSATIGVWVRVGGRDEPDDLAGASHFLEHLLFKGTQDRSAREIAEAVDAVGGDMNAFTSREHTAYFTRLPYQELSLGLEILGDVLTEPVFRSHEVDAERQVILEEILMNLDTPEDCVHSLLADALYPDHPLGREVLGTEETVEDLSRDEIAEFFHQWYKPSNLVVVAAGRLEHADVIGGLSGTLGRLSGGERPQRVAPTARPKPVAVQTRTTEQAHICLGWRGLPQSDDDRYALAVANQILGGGMSSRLFQEVREERGLAYSVYSYPSTYSDTGALTIYAGTAPRRATEVLSVVDSIVASLLAEGVTDQELRVAKGYLEGSLVLGLEDSGGRMARLGRSLMTRDDIITVDEHLASIDKVTGDDVSSVLHRVLDSERVLAAVGPFEAADLV